MSDETDAEEFDDLIAKLRSDDGLDQFDSEIQTPRFRTIARRIVLSIDSKIREIEQQLRIAEDQNKKIIESGLADHVRLLTADDHPHLLNFTKALVALRESRKKYSDFLGED